jgi:DNA-binding CsgD family transcriptional regulator
VNFERSFEDYMEASQTCASIDDLKQLFGFFASGEGFENHVLTTIGDRQLTNVAWFELPKHYPEAYIENKWERIDPILPASRKVRVAFSWSDALAGVKLNRAQQAFFHECHGLQVRNGIVIPLHGPDSRCDIFSLSRRTDEAPDAKRLRLTYAVAVQTWCRFLELSGTGLRIDSQLHSRVTERELEVLRWIKAGKTNQEIAEILNIKLKSVEFHVHNVLNKLGAPNRISAVVMALQNGLIG